MESLGPIKAEVWCCTSCAESISFFLFHLVTVELISGEDALLFYFKTNLYTGQDHMKTFVLLFLQVIPFCVCVSRLIEFINTLLLVLLSLIAFLFFPLHFMKEMCRIKRRECWLP